MIRLCAAMLTFTAVTACSGSASNPGTDSPSSSDPAFQIAALATGDMHPSSDEVSSWRARLGLLQTYCAGSERDMSDTIVQARKVAQDHGADVSYEEAAVGITHGASAAGGAQGQDCDKLAIDWVMSVARR